MLLTSTVIGTRSFLAKRYRIGMRFELILGEYMHPPLVTAMADGRDSPASLG